MTDEHYFIGMSILIGIQAGILFSSFMVAGFATSIAIFICMIFAESKK